MVDTWQKWSSIMCNLFRVILWDLLQRFSLGNIPFFQKILLEMEFFVSYDDIRSIFRAWNWSWKDKLLIIILINSTINITIIEVYSFKLRILFHICIRNSKNTTIITEVA
jgi:hypothetical protein